MAALSAKSRARLTGKYAKRGKKRGKRGFFGRRGREIERLLFLAGVALALALFLKFAVGLIFRGGGASIKLSDVETLRIPIASLEKLSDLSGKYDIPLGELLTVYSLENGFFPEKEPDIDTDGLEARFIAGYSQIKGKYSASALRPFVSLFSSITGEIKSFPVLRGQSGDEPPYIYGDSWGAPRSDSERAHEGCDILDRDNVRGRLGVVSMTDGAVTSRSWNNLGGYSVGITAESGNYYYYAHLDRYADGIEKGVRVRAGDLLGYMGDTGYGKEGTRGQFQVHLHVGISPAAKITKNEYWINPYPFLRLAEKNG